MTDQNAPDYGTPPERPEPKYGAYDHRLRRALADLKAEEERLAAALVDDLRRVRGPAPTRSWFGVTLALILLAIAAALAFGALQGGWWALLWVPFVPFSLFGVVGFAIDVRKVPRDENGRPIR